MMFLLTARSMTATVVIIFRFIAGSAAAGIAKFQRGCAGFTVTLSVRAVPVLLATRARVQGGGFIQIVGFRYLAGCCCCVFWHSFTIRTVAVR